MYYVRPIGELSSLFGGEKLFPLFLLDSFFSRWMDGVDEKKQHATSWPISVVLYLKQKLTLPLHIYYYSIHMTL